MKRILLCVGVLSFITACATTTPEVIVHSDPADEIIASSARDVANAIKELADTTGVNRVVVAKPKGGDSGVATPLRSGSIATARMPVPMTGQSIDQSTNQMSPQELGRSIVEARVTRSKPSSAGTMQNAPAGLEKLLTLKGWTGDLADLVSTIAAETGWQAVASKGLRVVPVIVSINAENKSAYDILIDAGSKAGSSADVVVSSQNKSITVVYQTR